MDEATFTDLAKSFKRIALFREMSADHLTPIQAFQALKGRCLLESAAETRQGRYSFIGANPLFLITDSYENLKTFRQRFNCHVEHPLALYTGGLVGFVSYDAIRIKENIPDRHAAEKELPDLSFNCYGTSLVFDHQSGSLVLGMIVEVGQDPREDYKRGEKELDALEAKINAPLPLAPLKKGTAAVVKTDLDDAAYGRMVEKAKENIRAGDVFQLVASRTFTVDCPAAAFDVYRALRQRNPSTYLFYFDLGDQQILGASPEKLISVQNGLVESMPIAGTRPIDGDEKELLADPKEVAEHMMLVDLARNDLGAVCVPGTVRVKELLKVYKYSHVMHIVSRIEGQLAAGLDAVDAFKASFPAGTLTGAPKVRAMELIDGMEASRRGLYGGAIVALDAAGNLDSCIAIRMGVVKEGKVMVRAGAGIVMDSDPQKEAEETRNKAKSVLEAVASAGGTR